MQGRDSVPAGRMSEAANSKTPHTPLPTVTHSAATFFYFFLFLVLFFALSQGRSHSHTSQVRDSEWWRLHRETPVRGKEAVYSTCTFYEQFLPMTTQQRSGQEGSKVHKYLPQQRRHFLQSALQLGGDAADGKEETEKKRQERNSETSDGFRRNNTVQFSGR